MFARPISSKRANPRALYFLSEHGIEPTVVAAQCANQKFGFNEINPPNVATLRNLIAGKHPVLSFPLRANRTIAGWEWSEGVSKTVSLCALVAPYIVRSAMKRAMQAVVDLTSRIVTPHGIFGGCNETLFDRLAAEPTWCAACFGSLHHYSRAADPQNHAHFLVFNSVHYQKRWVAADVSGLFKFQRLISQCFHSRLALALSEHGIPLRKRELGSGVVVWEVAGIPRTGLLEFSKRTTAVQSASGSRMKRKFGTRPPKREVNEESLRIEALLRLSKDQFGSIVRATATRESFKWPSPTATIRDIVGTEQGAGIQVTNAAELLQRIFRNPAACADPQTTVGLVEKHPSLQNLGNGLWSVGQDWAEFEGWLRAHVVSLPPNLQADSLPDVMRVRDVVIFELPNQFRSPRTYGTDHERQRGMVRRQIQRSTPCFEAPGSDLLRNLLGPGHTIYSFSDIGSHWEAVRKTPVVCLSLAHNGLTPHLLKRLRFESTRLVLIAPAAYKQISDFGRYLITKFPVHRVGPTKRELRSFVARTLAPTLESGRIVSSLETLRRGGFIDPAGVDVDRVLREHDNGKAPLVICLSREKADRFLAAFNDLLDRTAASQRSRTQNAFEPDSTKWNSDGWFYAYVMQNITGATRGSIVRIRSLHKDCAEIATMTGALLPVLPREHFSRLLALREASRKLRIGELIRFPVTCHTLKKERLSMHRPYRITGFLEENGSTLISLNGRYLIAGTTPLTVSPCVCVVKPDLRWEADTMWLDLTAPELAAVGGVSFLQKATSKAKYGLHLCGDTLANYRNALLAEKTRATEPDLPTLPQHGSGKAPSIIVRTTPEESLPER